MEAVSATGLVKRFETTVAVDGVDLAIAAGEVHGLLGANGAGKTTLLRMLLGLIAPDAGEVRLLERPLGGPGSAALDHVGGFVEEPAFYPYLSGAANLKLLAKLDVTDADCTRALVNEVLARVDLARPADDHVSGYSTGMRQRLGIAAALLRRPQLLLLDEPTSGLDPSGARAVATLVRELAGQGVAVLLSSHQIGDLERVCDAYSFMREGRIVWQGTATEMVATAPASAYAFATSDDERALALAGEHAGVRAARSPQGQLTIAVPADRLDELVFALGNARIAVRRLELLVSPLESMFFALSEGQSVQELAPHDLAARVFAGARR
ncbi:MAG: ABC transporter ATP-binding protein [Solirubrobacteraceae bacterium]